MANNILKDTSKYIFPVADPIVNYGNKKNAVTITESESETYKLRADIDFLLMMADQEVIT